MGNLKCFMQRIFGDMCEHADVCPFYSSAGCDSYYSKGWHCGIKREVDSGETWEWINLHHHKHTDLPN